MDSKKIAFGIFGFLYVVGIILFFIPFSDPNIVLTIQFLVVLSISVLSYMFVLAYRTLEGPPSATASDLDALFQNGTGELLFVQNTNNPAHNYLRFKLDRKYIDVTNDLDEVLGIRQSARKGIFQGAIVAPFPTFFLIWIRSQIYPDDYIILYAVLGLIVLALIIFVPMMFVAFKFEEKRFDKKHLLEIRKRYDVVEFSSSLHKKQLRKNAIFTNLRVSVPIDALEDELFFTSLPDEMDKNKQKMGRVQRMAFSVVKVQQKFPECLAVDLASENVKIIDQPIPSDTQEKFIASTFLIFAYHDKAIMESLRTNIMQWAKK